MPVNAMSRPVVMFRRSPERALRMPEARQCETIVRTARVPTSGVS
jgi:hypothetical protein